MTFKMSIQPNRLFSNVEHAKHQTLPKSQKTGVQTYSSSIGKVLSVFSNKVVKSELSGKDPIYVNVKSFRKFLKRHTEDTIHEKINSLTKEQITDIVNNLRNKSKDGQSLTKDMVKDMVKDSMWKALRDPDLDVLLSQKTTFETEREVAIAQLKKFRILCENNELIKDNFMIKVSLERIIRFAVLKSIEAHMQNVRTMGNKLTALLDPSENNNQSDGNEVSIREEIRNIRTNQDTEMKKIKSWNKWMEETLHLLENPGCNISQIQNRINNLKKKDDKIRKILDHW